MRICKIIFVVIVFLTPSLGYTQSRTEKYGRTPEGQAYRIDKEGYKLVDQLAELEVTVSELKNKIVELENEIEDKDLEIKKLSRDRGKSGEKIVESDINLTKPRCPEVNNCDEVRLPLESKIASLEGEAARAKAQVMALQTQITQTSKDNEVVDRQAATEAAEKLSLRDQLSKQTEAKKAEVMQKDMELSLSEQSLQQKNQEIAQLQNQLRQTEGKQQELNNKVGSLESSVAIYEKQFASLQKQGLAPTPRESSVTRTSTVGANAYQKPLEVKLASLQKLISERKDLYDRLKQSRSNVSISIQPLRTSDGETLDEVRGQVGYVRDEDSASQISEKLSQIEVLLNEDLKLLKRLNKI